MLIHLLLYYFFNNESHIAADASPILSSALNNMSSLPASFVSLAAQPDLSVDTCNCNQRSMLDIVWSCIATLFLCTWSSIHPNMPATNDEWWRILWRRLKTMYWTLVAPELILTWAVRQWVGARDIFNEHVKLYPNWTKTHAHFLQMGGFHLREGNKTSVLDRHKFGKLLKERKITFPSITKKDIDDKSKADALTKVVVVFQTLWFVIQCIGRRAQGLALAQLEVTTLAVISCTFILCIIWWDKPFDSQQPVYLDLLLRPEYPQRDVRCSYEHQVGQTPQAADIDNEDRVDAENSRENTPQSTRLKAMMLEFASFTFILCIFMCANLSVPQRSIRVDEGEEQRHKCRPGAKTSDERDDGQRDMNIGNTDNPTKMSSFLRGILTPIFILISTCSSIYEAVYEEVTAVERFEWGDEPLGLCICEICIGWTLLFPIRDLLEDDEVTQERRVGSYYSVSSSDASTASRKVLVPLLSAALFGLVHCISWNSDYPSAIEKTLWRISAVGVGSLPSILGSMVIVDDVFDEDEIIIAAFSIIIFPAYIFCRYYLLTEAILSLRALPLSAFQTIEWSDFLPHF